MRKLALLLFGFGFAAVGCSSQSAPQPSAHGGTASAAAAGTSQSSAAGLAGSGAGAAYGVAGAGGGAVGTAPDAGASSAGESGSSADGGAFGQGGAAAGLPAELLDLSSWKLTLPTGEAESPSEIVQPALATFELAPYFHVVGQAVLFRAHAGGVTTSGSGYPRSELREMTSDGSDEAAWSMTSGTHSLTIRQAITHLPVVKPHVVAGQIHDAEDDVVMIRLEGEHLFVEGGGEELGDLNPSYQLGTEFTVRIVAAGGVIAIYYDDLLTPKVEVPSDAADCYFKAGAYTQSNLERGDDQAAYGEVAIYDLEVTHE